MIDSHNHLHFPDFDRERTLVISEMKSVGITKCIVNSTTENDWHAVLSLCENSHGFCLPALGLHPWHLRDRSAHWFEKLTDLLEKNPQASIGECGLDLWMQNPNITDQLSVLADHFQLARDYQRPITIHCLKAWQPMMNFLKDQPIPKMLFHSFSGSKEIAQELMKKGAYFSFSGYFLHERKAAQREVFSHIPLTRILLETDAPSMLPPAECITHTLGNSKLHHPANLAATAQALAAFLQIPYATLIAQTTANAEEFFA